MSELSLPNLLVISAPSGAGKTSLIRALSQEVPFRRSISHTTRDPRAGEIEDEDYHFTNKAHFEKLILDGYFIEHANVYGNYYGTAWSNLAKVAQDDSWMLFEVDIQGFLALKNKVRNFVSIFILPPSLHELENRITKRQPDMSIEEKKIRLGAAKKEIAVARSYDYCIVNEDFPNALSELSFVLKCEKLRAMRKQHFIDRLLD